MILEARKNTPSTEKGPSKEIKFFGLEKFATTELQKAIDSDQEDEHENQKSPEFTTDENQPILQQNSPVNKITEIDPTPELNLEMVLKRITVVNDANQSVIRLEDIPPEREKSVLQSLDEIVILTD